MFQEIAFYDGTRFIAFLTSSCTSCRVKGTPEVLHGTAVKKPCYSTFDLVASVIEKWRVFGSPCSVSAANYHSAVSSMDHTHTYPARSFFRASVHSRCLCICSWPVLARQAAFALETFTRWHTIRGVYGGMVRDAPWRKLGGGNFVIIMMLVLVSIIIYCYMNTFITLHQCTFDLLFAFFSILI